MRLCRHCHKFNAGEPLRCRYCRAGLLGRLCPRNHVNPVDAHVSFCGDCGQPLERATGAGSPVLPMVGVVIGSILISAIIAAILSSQDLQQELFGMVIVLAILIGGVRFAFGILPSTERNFVGSIIKGLVNLLLGTGNKVK